MYRSKPRRPMNRPKPSRPDVFAEIVRRVPAVEAARAYGVAVNSRGLALCPFHAEDTPSCRFYPGDRGFYCFGCGAGGDVLTFTEKLLDLSPIEAARRLDADFHLGLFSDEGSADSASAPVLPKTPEQQAQEELDRLQALRPEDDPAAWGAARGRIEYLEYYLEEVRVRKCLEKLKPAGASTPPKNT